MKTMKRLREREGVPLVGRARRCGGRRGDGVVLWTGNFVIAREEEEIKIGSHSIEREPFRDISSLRNLQWDKECDQSQVGDLKDCSLTSYGQELSIQEGKEPKRES